MKKLILNSILSFLIYFSVGTVILTFSFIAAFAVDVNNVIFVKSKLSDDNYSVSNMLFRGQHIGCAAVNKLSEPTIVITSMLDGAGSISVVDSYINVNSNNKTAKLNIKIGNSTNNTTGIIQDKMVVFSISDIFLKRASSEGITVNDKVLPLSDVRRLYQLLDACNAKGT